MALRMGWPNMGNKEKKVNHALRENMTLLSS